MILVDTDVLIEIFDRNSEKGDMALEKIERTGEDREDWRRSRGLEKISPPPL